MASYWLIPGFEDLYLEDSWVLSIEAGPSSLSLLMDLVLRESHPDYRTPSRDERYCYRKGLIRFDGVSELTWKSKSMRPAIDASGEEDFGSIDQFEEIGDRYLVSGDFGTIEVTSEAPVVELLSDGSQRP